MNDPHSDLINALRLELQEYGEMLARLDCQQDSIMRRAADDVLASVTAIQDQALTLQSTRQSREQAQRRLARLLGPLEQATLAQLADAMPPHCRPLVRALIEENNQLLLRVQQRTRQNHLLLARSLDLMQNLIQTFFPVPQRGAYDGHGHSFAPTLPASALCDAAC